MLYNQTTSLQLFQKYHPSMIRQALHFIPIPCWKMNERFCLATTHYILQDEIKMFAMHPLPPTTQGTCHHLYEVNTNPIREISNRHLILFCARRWIGANEVNMSIPQWRNFNRWHNNSLQSSSNLPLFICCIENLNIVAH